MLKAAGSKKSGNSKGEDFHHYSGQYNHYSSVTAALKLVNTEKAPFSKQRKSTVGRVKRPPSGVETTISWTILGALVVIAVAVFIKQFDYDPAAVTSRVPVNEHRETLALNDRLFSNLSQFATETLAPMQGAENFGPETLADKINGKAELYLSAGFLGLTSQRFALHDDPESWMEAFVYDMGTPKHAFAVYSLQRRAEAEPLALTPFSYRTANALFFVHGKFYIEVVASVLSDPMTRAMASFGERFVEKIPGRADAIEETMRFPREDMIDGSIALLISDAFGFEGLDNVFTARYRVQGQEVTAFLSERKDDREALRLVQAYRDFLVSNGGTEAPEQASEAVKVTDTVTIRIFGDLELFFSCGRYMAGVRDTETLRVAQEVAQRMMATLKGLERSGGPGQ